MSTHAQVDPAKRRVPPRPRMGRPPTVERGVEVSAYLTERQVMAVEAHRRERGLKSFSEALREILERRLEA